MKIKLIAPANKKLSGFWDMVMYARLVNKKFSRISLALPTIAALTPPDIDVVITDENIEEIDFDEKVDLVGITANTYTAIRAYEIADEYRKRGIKTVIGGMHASVLPDEASKHADSVVIGEAEGVWNRLLEDFKNNALKRIYQNTVRPDLKNSPIPKWDLVKTDQYLYHTIQSTRGCPYDCDFCSVKLFFGKEYRFKPIGNVLKEVEYLLKIDKHKVFIFVDDNIIANKKYAKELFEALIPCNIRWGGEASVDIGFDTGMLDLMYKSGCRHLLLGFESLSQRNLQLINKPKINKVEEYSKIIENIHKHRISVIGAFILGNDFDDETVFEKIRYFVEVNSIPFLQPTVLTPLPGTRLYKRMKEDGRLLNEDWTNYNLGQLCFIPKLMSPENFKKGYLKLIQDIYSCESIDKRFNKLWGKGVFVKTNSRGRKIFTKNGFMLLLRSLLMQNINANYILLKGLLDKRGPSLASLLGALTLNDFAKKYKV